LRAIAACAWHASEVTVESQRTSKAQSSSVNWLQAVIAGAGSARSLRSQPAGGAVHPAPFSAVAQSCAFWSEIQEIASACSAHAVPSGAPHLVTQPQIAVCH